MNVLYLTLGVAALVFVLVLIAMLYRVVVSTNDVHIVQSGKKTTSYGKDQADGNVYYAWPAWIPKIGVKVIVLPVAVFDVDLDGYAAYDKGRVPFMIDIMAFFRVVDSNLAAQRVASFDELGAQLQGVLKGACRSILASSEIEEILEGRSKFGELFTKEVDHNLAQWGVQSVKQIELMDIRDGAGSKVIENIMAKKKSLIEMQSRREVAENMRAAQTAEIEAAQMVDIRRQEAAQLVGQRTAEKDRVVGVANQEAIQMIKESERVTTQKHYAVIQVQEVRQAEITRDVNVVAADQQRQTAIIKAEGEKQQTIIIADGELEKARRNATGIEVEGNAKGSAETAILMAPVNSQIALAKEIGANDGYQKYLLGVREIERAETVGVANAAAIKEAEIKVIANTGSAVEGIESVSELFTARGGTKVGAMLEGLANTPVGSAVVRALKGGDKDGKAA